MTNYHEIEIDRVECSKLAETIFFRTSGISGNTRKAERMRRDAMIEREKIEDRIMLRAAYAFYDDIAFDGRQAVIGGQVFTCSAFEQIRESAVHGAYVYAVSAGDFAFPEESVMNQLYADIWGSAFADAARIYLNREMEKKSKLSDSFGPGFYGMEISEMTKIAALVDLMQLDIQVKGSGILLPLKSCAGIYLSVDDSYEKLPEACSSCKGNRQSCKLCRRYEIYK